MGVTSQPRKIYQSEHYYIVPLDSVISSFSSGNPIGFNCDVVMMLVSIFSEVVEGKFIGGIARLEIVETEDDVELTCRCKPLLKRIKNRNERVKYMQ